MVGAISKRTHCTGTCMSQYDVQLQASICLQSIVILFEHRGEGTNLEFGKRCNAYRTLDLFLNLEFGKRCNAYRTLDLFLLRNGDNCRHFAAPSCGRAVADSQNFWRLEVRTLFCRSNRPSSAPCVAVFISPKQSTLKKCLSFLANSPTARRTGLFSDINKIMVDALMYAYPFFSGPGVR